LKATAAALAGSVLSGLLASACCLAPVILTLLGVSGAALASGFEPWRLPLLVAAYGLLAVAFFLSYRPRRAECPPDEACARPGPGSAARVMLWIGALLVVLFTAFPWYSRYLF